MTLPRITALATILVHLVASVAMGLVYLCQMSGQVGLSACCCESQRQGRQASHHDAAHAPGCCDVTQVEASLVPSLPEQRAAGPLPVAAWSVPADAPRPALRHGSARAPARVALAPPESPPLYLRTRALLL